MPLYRWQGVDDHGSLKKGTLRAASLEELQAILGKTTIALLSAQVTSVKALTTSEKDLLFSHLATLLEAHIPLYEALIIMGTTHPSSTMRQLVSSIADQVAQGTSFTKVLEEYRCHDAVSRALVGVGEATGSLGPLLREIVTYRTTRAAAIRHIKQALMGPAITLSFFMVLCGALVIFVVPQMGSYFAALALELPRGFSLLLFISSYCTAPLLIFLLITIVLLSLGIHYIVQSSPGKRFVEKLIVTTPLVSSVYRTIVRGRILKALGLLLVHHVSLSAAIKACEEVTDSELYRKELTIMRMAIDQGTNCSKAWSKSSLCSPESEALIALGEQTGRLAELVLYSAEQNDTRLHENVKKVISLLNPLGIVVIGLLIAALIGSLYLPLITMASSIV